MALTPMMQQYLEIKEGHKDAILFFRLGDFYEMFFEDALVASKALEITLTARDGGQAEKIPMCGVPFHAAEGYIAKLIEKGFKVAVCEQVEDPKVTKGIVKREVVRIITPGTILESQMLKEKQNNYLMSLCLVENNYGLAIADISTGQFLVTSFIDGAEKSKLFDEIDRLQPAECLIQEQLFEDFELHNIIKNRGVKIVTSYPNWSFKEANAKGILEEHFGVYSIDSLGIGSNPSMIGAAGGLIDYLKETQKKSLKHLNKLEVYNPQNFMILDNVTRRNLELTKTMRNAAVKGSLLWVLDNTVTAMGGRLLKAWVEQPLIKVEDINNRLQSIEEFIYKPLLKHDLVQALKEVYDLERIISRTVYGTANPKDMVALKNSIQQLPIIKALLMSTETKYLNFLGEELDPQYPLAQQLEACLQEEPPFSLREGGIIKVGYNEELDKLRKAQSEGKAWIARLESQEKERTGIKSLKVGFNKVFGFYIEVTKSNLALVPADYIRKQTLSNGERYITPELKEYENLILGAEEKINQLEYELFIEIRAQVAKNTKEIQKAGKTIAILDSILSLAEAALVRGYVKPVVTTGNSIKIEEGRHPVVEAVLEGESFISNETVIGEDAFFHLITGPNMAGKSTYMRQVALITLMAQIGSYVPATACEIGVVDRIFTRVGASDDLATGQSTFMVEMIECQIILNGASNRSLVIMDEVGRGTSTYDGISIARALAEYICERIGCKTLFSTHYHELTDLESFHKGIENYTVAVKEQGDDIIFLRKVIKGKADRSYGIHVAQLAGFPEEILERASCILKELETNKAEVVLSKEGQLSLFSKSPREEVLQKEPDSKEKRKNMDVIKELKALDLLTMTPLEAINKLFELKSKLS